MNEKKEHKFLKSVLIYAAFFVTIAVFIIYTFLKHKKGFIWGEDGLNQHMISLRYFRDLLINFIKTGDFSTFTWNIGNGINMYGNLAYYIFGDVFSYFCIFVPSKYMEYFYSSMVIVRMFFIGIAFLYFCNYKKMSRNSSIIGALMYTFCSFALFSAVRHPYFCNALILFPLVMIGMEKIVKEDKKIFYTLIITILYLGNFYFAYMISLIIAIYAIALIIHTYKKEGVKKIVRKTLQVLFFSVIGVMISAILLLPTGIEFLNSERSMSDKIQPYTVSYYRELVCNIINCKEGSYWVYTGVSSIILITLPIFIKNRKKDYPIFWLLTILIFPLLISNIGSIFCGFSYPNNRWSFVIAFIFSYITVMFINDGCKIEKEDIKYILLFLIIFAFLNIIVQKSISIFILGQLLIFMIQFIILLYKDRLKNIKKLNLFKILFVLIFITGILLTIQHMYEDDKNDSPYVSEFINVKSFNKKGATSNNKISDFDKAIKFILGQDKSFYTISKYPVNFDNVAIIEKYRSKTIYYSILPKYYGNLCMDLQNISYQMNKGFSEFDYRTKISTLLGTKYYIQNSESNYVPYGYSKIDKYDGKSNIYVNNYSLPFGVLYTSYITGDEYKDMTALEKESSLLKTVVLEESDNQNNINHNETAIKQIKNNDIKNIDYELIDDDDIIKNDKIIITDLEKNKIKFKIGNVVNSEIYLNIENIKFEPLTRQDKINKELSDKPSEFEIKSIEKKYKWYEPNYEYNITASFNNKTSKKKNRNYKVSPYYIKNDQMLANLGYYENTSGEIVLEFDNIGTYDLSNIKIFAVSMNDYADDIENLRKSNFEVQEYKNGYLKATTNPEEDGVLQFATLYNKGWKVYVDGNEVETLVANKYFLGINISKGSHEIEMKYTTPYLREGIIISILGILAFIGAIIFNKKNK